MEELNIEVLSGEYAVSIVEALAIAQKKGTINGPSDLTLLISAGIEEVLTDFKQKLIEQQEKQQQQQSKIIL